MKKTAVILFNLGGPDSKESIKPFLFNFFMDPAIIGAPKPVRWLLAKYISFRRSGKEAGKSYSLLDYKSPLFENSQKQAEALEGELNRKGTKGTKYKCFVCMRYWHPMADEIAVQVKGFAPDQIILLPLYPQFSTTTSGSSFKDWKRVAEKQKLDVPVTTICCYPEEAGFIDASAALIKEIYDKACEKAEKRKVSKPRLLFSAHGLPEKIIESGDPYQWQCEMSAEKIVDRLAIEGLDWQICYQSRVGPLKWIGPSTGDALVQASKESVPVIIYPHAFVSEHIETLVEIDIEYREEAKRLGIPFFEKVPTVGAHPLFIKGLASVIKENRGAGCIASSAGRRICPANFAKCCMAKHY